MGYADQLSTEISDILVNVILIALFIIVVLKVFNVIEFKYSIKDLEYIELFRSIDTIFDDGDEDHVATVSIEKPKKSTKKKVTKKKPKKPKKSIKLSPFENDCVSALTSLGVKKSTAKADVKSFLENRNIDTVEEFLQQYMKARANVKNS